jgi:hypothetical protein
MINQQTTVKRSMRSEANKNPPRYKFSGDHICLAWSCPLGYSGGCGKVAWRSC